MRGEGLIPDEFSLAFAHVALMHPVDERTIGADKNRQAEKNENKFLAHRSNPSRTFLAA